MTIQTAIVLANAFAKDHLKSDYKPEWEGFIDNLTGDCFRTLKHGQSGYVAFIKQWDGYKGITKKVIHEFYKACRGVMENAQGIETD